MRRLGFLCLLLASPLYAGTVEWNDQKVDYEESWSLKNFSQGKDFDKNIPPGTTVYASSFYTEEPDSVVFDSHMTGVTFIECNLDNVVIPPGNLIKNVYNDPPVKFKAQNDLRDWIVDDKGKPVKLKNEVYWKDQGLSVDPKDIPIKVIDSYDKIPKATAIVP